MRCGAAIVVLSNFTLFDGSNSVAAFAPSDVGPSLSMSACVTQSSNDTGFVLLNENGLGECLLLVILVVVVVVVLLLLLLVVCDACLACPLPSPSPLPLPLSPHHRF